MNCPSNFPSSLVLALLLCATSALQAETPPTFEVAALTLPGLANSAQPDLVSSADGSLYLSWVEKQDMGHRLRFSRIESTLADGSKLQWSPAQTIASGDDWFVNWADTPHLVVFKDGTLWAHWLRKNGSAVYDYGVALVRSEDHGRTWSKPIRLEPEDARLDYGFVSLWEQGTGVLGIAWLDSRQKHESDASHGGHDEHGGGEMMLRAANFDAEGKRIKEWALDNATCDCCPTSVATTKDGPVIVYRGRTPEEIRDMQLVRFDGTDWSKPATVHADKWKFAGCPVNGPAVVANGNDVWVAWYTEGGDRPSVRLAQSRDAGRTFEAPLQIAQGTTLLGRVDLAIDAENLWVTWLVEDASDNSQQLMLAQVDAKSGILLAQEVIADLSAKGRASGSPQLQAQSGSAWLVWTDSIDGKSHLRGVSVRAK